MRRFDVGEESDQMGIVGGPEDLFQFCRTALRFRHSEEHCRTAEHQVLFKLRIPVRPDGYWMWDIAPELLGRGQYCPRRERGLRAKLYFLSRHSQLVEHACMGNDEVGRCAVAAKGLRKLFFKSSGSGLS